MAHFTEVFTSERPNGFQAAAIIAGLAVIGAGAAIVYGYRNMLDRETNEINEEQADWVEYMARETEGANHAA